MKKHLSPQDAAALINIVDELGKIPLGNVRCQKSRNGYTYSLRIQQNNNSIYHSVSQEEYTIYRTRFQQADNLTSELRLLLDRLPRSIRRTTFHVVQAMRKKQTALFIASRKKYPETLNYYTSHGDMVRSRGEAIISEILESLGLSFEYEKPLKMHNNQVLIPDFTIQWAGKEYYIEFCGMIDDKKYTDNLNSKASLYEVNGIRENEQILYLSGSSTSLDINQYKWEILRFLIAADSHLSLNELDSSDR